MAFKPCIHCAKRKGCLVKDNIAASIRGLEITTLSFICPLRLSDLQPGTRVLVDVLDYQEAGEQDDYMTGESHHIEPEKIQVPGTVMKPWRSKHTGKVYVWLDHPVEACGNKPGREYGILRFWPDQCHPTQEPRVVVCRKCGRPKDNTAYPEWRCETVFYGDGLEESDCQFDNAGD